MEAETQAVTQNLQKAQEPRPNLPPKTPLDISRPDPGCTHTGNINRPVAHRQAPTVPQPAPAYGDSQQAATQQPPLVTRPQHPPSTTPYQAKPSSMNNPPPGYLQPGNARPSQYAAPPPSLPLTSHPSPASFATVTAGNTRKLSYKRTRSSTGSQPSPLVSPAQPPPPGQRARGYRDSPHPQQSVRVLGSAYEMNLNEFTFGPPIRNTRQGQTNVHY